MVSSTVGQRQRRAWPLTEAGTEGLHGPPHPALPAQRPQGSIVTEPVSSQDTGISISELNIPTHFPDLSYSNIVY